MSGTPQPSVEWLFNAEKILEGDRANSSTSGDQATLRISDALPEDAGEYCCQATNTAGFEVSKATLTVSTVPQISEVNGAEPPGTSSTSEGPLKLLSDLESKIVQEKVETVLECKIEGE